MREFVNVGVFEFHFLTFVGVLTKFLEGFLCIASFGK